MFSSTASMRSRAGRRDGATGWGVWGAMGWGSGLDSPNVTEERCRSAPRTVGARLQQNTKGMRVSSGKAEAARLLHVFDDDEDLPGPHKAKVLPGDGLDHGGIALEAMDLAAQRVIV